MDSAAVPDVTGGDDEDGDKTKVTKAKSNALEAALKRNFEKVAGSIPPNTWLLTHAPFKGVRVGKKSGDTEVDNILLQDAIGHLLEGVNMIVSGHIHLFEALNFADGSAPQVVVGTGSTKLAKRITKEPSQITGSRVKVTIVKHFGYMVWDRGDREPTIWDGTLFSEKGAPILHCQLEQKDLHCN